MVKDMVKGMEFRCMFRHILIRVMIIVAIISSITPMLSFSAESETNQYPEKKSYFLACSGAFITPALGHAYIGGDNIRRGVLYTTTEIWCITAEITNILRAIISYDDDNFKAYFEPGDLMQLALATHAISMVDAAVSVHSINNRVPTKSYIISTGGSAIFPPIGHGYLNRRNNIRGWIYGISQMAFAIQKKPNIVHGIRYVSMLDAFVSTYRYNQAVTKVMLVPGDSSLELRILKTF